MSGPVRPLGGFALKHARHEAGVTQAELATRSRLSVRTVRGLESGSTRYPHEQSLVAVARALEMTETKIQEFLECWARSGERTTFEALLDAGNDAQHVTADIPVPVHDDYEDISVFETVTVGLDGRIVALESQVTMRALSEGTDRRVVLWGRGATGQDLNAVRLGRLGNCTAGEKVKLPKLDLIAYELSLGRALAKGETHVLSYAFDFSDAYPGRSGPQDLPFVQEASHGFRRPLLIWTLLVEFRCPVPEQIWQFRGPPTRRRVERQLESDAFGSVHITCQNVSPGEYGIAWEW